MTASGNLMRGFGKYVAKLLKEDWDWWAIFDGGEGCGKSTCAIWWAHYVSGKKFEIKDHVCYDAEGFLELVDTTPRFGTILLDEGGEAWLNRDYATRISKALGKAAQGIRDRNLNVVICVPSLYLLDGHAIRRHKTWVNVTAPGFERGKSDWYKPIWNTFGPQKEPYWDLKLTHYFPQLPRRVDDEYRHIKTKMGEERLKDYLNQIRKEATEKDQMTAEEVIAKVKKDPEKYRNQRDKFDRRLIIFYTKVPHGIAEQAALILNQEGATD